MIFTFGFDDGYHSWLDASKVLEEHGFRGTFNVCLRNVVQQRLTERKRMFPPSDVITWDEVLDLQNRGHEVASHGVRHCDFSRATDAEIRLEFEGSLSVFRSRGVNVETYACAFNNWTERADKVGREFYKVIRGPVGVNYPPFKTRNYKCLSGEAAVNMAESNPKADMWVVGNWHDINPDGFRSQVERVKRLGVEVKTVRGVTR